MKRANANEMKTNEKWQITDNNAEQSRTENRKQNSVHTVPRTQTHAAAITPSAASSRSVSDSDNSHCKYFPPLIRVRKSTLLIHQFNDSVLHA